MKVKKLQDKGGLSKKWRKNRKVKYSNYPAGAMSNGSSKRLGNPKPKGEPKPKGPRCLRLTPCCCCSIL